MSEGKQLRLGQVARKLNVGRNTIISYLQDKGYEIDSNPNTKIDDSLFKILENAFEDSAVAVSYTHLTLPTILLV